MKVIFEKRLGKNLYLLAEGVYHDKVNNIDTPYCTLAKFKEEYEPMLAEIRKGKEFKRFATSKSVYDGKESIKYVGVIY